MDKLLQALVGKPYRAQGRGPDHYDCWGLAMEASRIIRGREIPDYKLDPDATENNAFIAWTAANDGTWCRVEPKDVKPGLIVAFQLIGTDKITHVGITVDKNRFLQATKCSGVTLEHMDKYQRIIEGYYEFKG